MKLILKFIFAAFITIGLFNACSADEEQKQQQIQEARQDSLLQARQRQQRLREQRMDSLAAARADSIAQAMTESGEPVFNPNVLGITMDEEGSYGIQVGAWRSEAKARRLAVKWQQRGFENAFVVKYGNEAVGDIWFRVRLGKFFAKNEAQELQAWLQENYQARSWITHVE